MYFLLSGVAERFSITENMVWRSFWSLSALRCDRRLLPYSYRTCSLGVFGILTITLVINALGQPSAR